MPSTPMLPPAVAERLHGGTVIPAHPLALTEHGRIDETRQQGLTRYYIGAGAGGIAVGVHTTQFEIRERGLLAPVLELAACTLNDIAGEHPVVKVAGVCGPIEQAVAEAELAHRHGYHLALVTFAGLPQWTNRQYLAHIAAVGQVLPVVGFYLQPRIGGPILDYSFWRSVVDLDCLAAIKIAPFDRYRTLDVVRAVCSSGRADDIALYTGNDDHIVLDWLTPFRIGVAGRTVEKRIVGGLLGQAAVWTAPLVRLHQQCMVAQELGILPVELLTRAAELTDANAAVFDAANGFAGCVPGIHEVLRRQRLLDHTCCLHGATLSPGQCEEIDRVANSYPQIVEGPVAGTPHTRRGRVQPG